MKSFCIIGLGSFGHTLAATLAAAGRQVMVVDEDAQRVNDLADVVTNAVIGDPTNDSVLKNSGVRNYDCAVNCLSTDLNDSILVTVILKELGVRQVVARAGSPRHKSVLEKLGADMVVFPEHDMAEKLAELLMRKNVIDYVEMGDGYCIAEIDVPGSWVGRSIVELDLRKKQNLSVISILSKNKKINVSPDPSTVFAKEDHVTLLGKQGDVDRLTGKA